MCVVCVWCVVFGVSVCACSVCVVWWCGDGGVVVVGKMPKSTAQLKSSKILLVKITSFSLIILTGMGLLRETLDKSIDFTRERTISYVVCRKEKIFLYSWSYNSIIFSILGCIEYLEISLRTGSVSVVLEIISPYLN